MGGDIHGGKRTKIISGALWGAFLLLFCVLEALGIAHRRWGKIPWFSASESEWSGLQVLPPWARWIARVLVITFCASLGVHFAFGTTLLP